MSGSLVSETDLSPESSPELAISIRNLHKRYGSNDNEVRAVDGVSLDIESGSIVGLLGPNGAGKTTTIKCALGLILPDEGSVTVLGRDLDRSPHRVYRHVGAVFEGARNVYWRLTVRQNLEFFTRLTGSSVAEKRDRHDELLRRFDLVDKADVPVKSLSRGMKQKVTLASTLSRDVDIVFLDEPTLGLDLETSLALRKELRRMVAEENLTVVLSSHEMNVIEDLCDRVVIMNDGNVVRDDSVENLLNLFHNNTYLVRLHAPLPPEARTTLRDRFPIDNWQRHEDVHEFEVAVTGEEFHALSDAIRELDCSLHSVETLESDLSDVFLELTGDT